MKSWTLTGTDATTKQFFNEPLSTVEELEAALSRALASATSETLFFVNSPSGATLSFGVSEGHAYVEFTEDSDVGPYFLPVGDPALAHESGGASFMFTGHHTEIPLRNCVRPDQVTPLVREFFETDSRPTSVDWED